MSSFKYIKQKICFTFLIVCLIHQNINGQNSFSLKVQFSDSIAVKKLNLTSVAKPYPNKVARQAAVKSLLKDLHTQGYLTASCDSITTDSLQMNCYCSIGHQYKWARLRKGNVDEQLLSEIRFREKLYTNKPLKYQQVNTLFETILTRLENNGYPFANIKLDSIKITDNTMYAALNLNREKLFFIDTIKVIGNSKIALPYLYNYLKIKPGDYYNESVLQNLEVRVSELPFISLNKAPEIQFYEDHLSLTLDLKKKNASNFNGILGILPNNETGEILITGDARIKLQNSFGNGELIDINWRKLQNETQDLKTRLIYPFILNTPFGGDFSFKLYKRDTTFINFETQVGVQYILKGGNYFKAFIDNKTTNLLLNSEQDDLTVLPPNLDTKTLAYGLSIRTNQLDYRPNPREGYTLELSSSLGTKSIIKNDLIPENLYDSLTLKSLQWNTLIETGLYLPLFERSVFYARFQGGYLINQNLFVNELYRIGGLKTLRGFDEESINTSSYSIMSIEYRYILDKNSFLHLFADGAYYENTSNTENTFAWPIGYGAGMSFETKAGIFSVDYALGQHLKWRKNGETIEDRLSLKRGKIHFGFINFF